MNTGPYYAGFPQQDDEFLRIRLTPNDFEDRFYLTIRKLIPAPHRVLYPAHIEWAEATSVLRLGDQPGEELFPPLPASDMRYIMDKLWDLGIRPSDFRMPPPVPSGVAEAKEAHLADLRKILDRSLTIVERLSPPLIHMELEEK